MSLSEDSSVDFDSESDQDSEFSDFNRWDELPSELLCEIISYFQTDTHTMKDISYVSKAWRDSSLCFLFSTFIAKNAEDFIGLKSFILRQPQVKNHIRTFAWQPDWVEIQLHNGLNHIMPPPIPLPTFPDVTDLRWSTEPGPSQAVTVGPAIRLLLSSFPSLATLDISATFPHIGALEEFLSLCGNNVQDILFEEIDLIDDEAFEFALPAAGYSLSNLKRLTVGYTSRFDCGWIPYSLFRFYTCSPKNLTSISITMEAFDRHSSGKLLDMFSSTLQMLTLSAPIDSASNTLVPQPAQDLKELQILTLGLFSVKDEITPGATKEWLWSKKVLSNLSAPALRTLRCSFQTRGDDLYNILAYEKEWDRLKTVLCSERFPSLQTIAFHMRIPYEYPSAIKADFEDSAGKVICRIFGLKFVCEWGSSFR